MTNKTTFQEYAAMRSDALVVQGRNTTALHYDTAIGRKLTWEDEPVELK